MAKHFVLSFEFEQFVLEVADGAFEIVELELMVAFDLVEDFEAY